MGNRLTPFGLLLEQMSAQLRDALAGADWDFQVEAGMILNPTPPTVDVYPADPGRELELTGGFGATDAEADDGLWVNVRARISPLDHNAGQEILVELMDPASELSLVQAIYDDPTLNGYATDVNLESQTGYVLVPTIDGGAVHIGVIWRFLVIPDRS